MNNQLSSAANWGIIYFILSIPFGLTYFIFLFYNPFLLAFFTGVLGFFFLKYIKGFLLLDNRYNIPPLSWFYYIVLFETITLVLLLAILPVVGVGFDNIITASMSFIPWFIIFFTLVPKLVLGLGLIKTKYILGNMSFFVGVFLLISSFVSTLSNFGVSLGIISSITSGLDFLVYLWPVFLFKSEAKKEINNAFTN